jgi:undecaprenyl pyrophosphate phosphatase UppP
MTTFQILIESFLKALTTVLPVSGTAVEALTHSLLNWSLPVSEIELLIYTIASFVFLIFFRYDWLGLISAGLTSVFRPMSLRSESRSLDQHTLIFILIALLPAKFVEIFAGSTFAESGLAPKPVLAGAGLLITGFALLASSRWNKRIHGLNHLRLAHAIAIAGAGVLSLVPGFPAVGLIWIAFAFCNYHFEAIYKYTGILIGIGIFSKTIELLQNQAFRDAFDQIGYLNSGAVVVIAFTVIWISLENLQKNLSESIFRNFQWLSMLTGAALIILFFMDMLPE